MILFQLLQRENEGPYLKPIAVPKPAVWEQRKPHILLPKGTVQTLYLPKPTLAKAKIQHFSPNPLQDTRTILILSTTVRL